MGTRRGEALVTLARNPAYQDEISFSALSTLHVENGRRLYDGTRLISSGRIYLLNLDVAESYPTSMCLKTDKPGSRCCAWQAAVWMGCVGTRDKVERSDLRTI
jgi:hypothetical protein